MKIALHINSEREIAQELFLFSGKRALGVNLSMSDIARFLEVTPGCVARLLKGQTYPQLSLCSSIRRFHGIMQEKYPIELKKTGASTVKPIHVTPQTFRKQITEQLFAYD